MMQGRKLIKAAYVCMATPVASSTKRLHAAPHTSWEDPDQSMVSLGQSQSIKSMAGNKATFT
jgi:hypothetical protein